MTKNINQNMKEELRSKIIGFKNLEENWDSYNSNKISLESIKKALSILELLDQNFSEVINRKELEVFPMRSGGIQFEFDNNHISVEIEIFHDELEFASFDKAGEILQHIPEDVNIDQVIKYLRKLLKISNSIKQIEKSMYELKVI